MQLFLDGLQFWAKMVRLYLYRSLSGSLEEKEQRTKDCCFLWQEKCSDAFQSMQQTLAFENCHTTFIFLFVSPCVVLIYWIVRTIGSLLHCLSTRSLAAECDWLQVKSVSILLMLMHEKGLSLSLYIYIYIYIYIYTIEWPARVDML